MPRVLLSGALSSKPGEPSKEVPPWVAEDLEKIHAEDGLVAAKRPAAATVAMRAERESSFIIR
jgi:hypothetical protein